MPKNYTVKEFAELFRRSQRTVYRWIKEERIRTIRVVDGYLIPEKEVRRIQSKGL